MTEALKRISGALVLVVGLLFVIALTTLPAPTTLTSLSTRTETILIEIADSRDGAFKIGNARDADGMCFADAQIIPTVGASVYYTMERGGDLVVAVDGAHLLESSFRKNDEMSMTVVERPFSSWRLSTRDKGCSSDAVVRLPVNGHIEVGLPVTGGHLADPPLPLLEGEVVVHGRAIGALLFGRLPIPDRALAVPAGSLFEAGRLTIPPGSSVSSREASGQSAYWWGFVDAEPGVGRGMDVMVSSNAGQLALMPAAPDTTGTDSLSPETVSLTLMARLAGDPNIRFLAFLAGASSVGLGIVSWGARMVLPNTRFLP